jgi:four helix bundle protein
MQAFDHERLDVYETAIDFLVVADAISDQLPRGRGYLRDQLQRAALSISNNIAEGAGQYSNDEKLRFYRIAKRSATECAAILDACRALQIIDSELLDRGRQPLLRIVSMLIKMARNKR